MPKIDEGRDVTPQQIAALVLQEQDNNQDKAIDAFEAILRSDRALYKRLEPLAIKMACRCWMNEALNDLRNAVWNSGDHPERSP